MCLLKKFHTIVLTNAEARLGAQTAGSKIKTNQYLITTITGIAELIRHIVIISTVYVSRSNKINDSVSYKRITGFAELIREASIVSTWKSNL